MSSTTEIITFLDAQTDFLNRVRASTSASASIVLAKRYLNTALRDMHVNPGNKFPWAERRGMLVTRAPYTTGSVTIDVDTSRTAVTGTSTLWTTTDTFGLANVRVGGKIKFAGVAEVYEVASVGGAGSLTLATQYTGDDITAQTYTYFEDEYALASDFLRFLDLNIFSTEHQIPLIGRQEFRRLYGRNDSQGHPKTAAHIQLGFSSSTAPRHRVVLNPHPSDEYSLPYWYVTSNLAVSSAGSEQARMVEDTDEPIVPIQYRVALVLHAVYHFYRDYKDDQRSQEAKAEYVDFMTRVTGDTRIGDDRPQFIVRGRRSYKKQRFDSGGRFDELRDR